MTDFLLAAAGQPWIYAVIALCCLIDGFFPPFPSEVLVVGLASLAASEGGTGLWMLLPSAAAGAFLGDLVAYALGRRVGTTRFRWMRRPFMQRSFARARSELQQRAVSMILVARFIPGARVAVNFTAGATKYRRRTFAAISTLSAILWASYSVGIGVLAGAWFRGYPILGLLGGIVIAGVAGFVIDKATGVLRTRHVADLGLEGQVAEDGQGVAPPAVVPQEAGAGRL